MLDCGATYPGGRLAAICLDTGVESAILPKSRDRFKFCVNVKN